MKKGFFALVLGLFVAGMLLFSGCTSTVKSNISDSYRVEDGVYVVRLNPDYSSESAIRYAINEFVKTIGRDSYDYTLVQRHTLSYNYDEYRVTTPGSIPVEDLAEVTVVDSAKTGGAIGTTVEILLYVGGAIMAGALLFALGSIGAAF